MSLPLKTRNCHSPISSWVDILNLGQQDLQSIKGCHVSRRLQSVAATMEALLMFSLYCDSCNMLSTFWTFLNEKKKNYRWSTILQHFKTKAMFWTIINHMLLTSLLGEDTTVNVNMRSLHILYGVLQNKRLSQIRNGLQDERVR